MFGTSFISCTLDSFVLKWCDRGRGLKPDWASKGMDFLIFAANPENTKYIADEEFEVGVRKVILESIKVYHRTSGCWRRGATTT